MLRARQLAGACLAIGCLAAAPWAAAPQPAKEAGAPVRKAAFGQTKEGVAVELYTLTNHHGMVAKVMTYGATLTELHVENAAGKPANIVLGYDRLEPYLAGVPYFGATVGRVGNRIARGEFTLDGRTYQLATNDNGVHHLHGGRKGFDKVVWRAEEVKSLAGPTVKFSYRSPDGEEGYPGTLDISVTYTLTDANELRLDYHAVADKATPVNLTNHSYFNLAGDGQGDILGHVMMIASDRMTKVDERLIPTGEIVPVKGTPWDFSTPTAIGARIQDVPGGPPVGYDHNYVLRKEEDSGQLASASRQAPIAQLAARVLDPKSGRTMEVLTTEPGMQFYSGNFLDGSLKSRGGVPYRQYAAFCLETQHFPDSVHHSHFPSTILKPRSEFTSTTIYRFGHE
jgi:aldose 1-epimerase